MMFQSSADTNRYFNFKIKNSFNVLIIHNPIYTKTSCALSVKKGSFDEPDDVGGLAHFLEHMLFMGTKKYPGENDFGEFLAKHNGYSNAYTGEEVTVYYCDVDSAKTEELMDRFLSFFTCPLLKEDSVKREISAVNSEFLNSLTSSHWRTDALLKEFMIDGVKEKRFTFGNEDTLRRNDILEKVTDFYKNSYSSDIMNLVVCTNFDVFKLEHFIKAFCHETFFKKENNFNSTTSKNIHEKSKSNDNTLTLFERLFLKCEKDPSIYDNFYFIKENRTKIFNPEYFSKVIQFEPLDDKKELIVTKILPPLILFYKTNPLGYISFMLTSKEKGHFLSRLKSNKLGFDVSFSCEHYETYTKLTISVELTELGATNYVDVLDLLLNSLNKIKIDQTEYFRLRRLHAEEFEFSSMENPLNLVERLAPLLYYYPYDYILNHEYIFENYSYEIIKGIVQDLIDTSSWIILLSKKDENFDFTETLYNVKYKILESYAPTFEKFESENKEPEKDRFLNQNVILEPKKRDTELFKTENGCILYVFDSLFKVPKSEVYLMLSSDEIYKNEVIFEIYVKLLEDFINERNSRSFINCHVRMDFEVIDFKICFKIYGFSEAIPCFGQLLLFYLNEIPLTRFDVIKRELENEYIETISRSPFKRIREVFKSKLMNGKTTEEKLKILKTIDKCIIRLPKNYFTEIVAVGNIELPHLVTFYEKLVKNKKMFKYSINTNFESLSFETIDQNNNLMALFYKVNDYRESIEFVQVIHDEFGNVVSRGKVGAFDELKNSVIARFILTIGHDDFFNELRTIEELGYVVGSDIMNFLSTEFLVFYVQSEKSVEFLEERIKKFVSDLEIKIKEMDDLEFQTFKESLIAYYEEPIYSLEELSHQVVDLWAKSRVDLFINNRYALIGKELTKNDLLNSKILTNPIKLFSTKK